MNHCLKITLALLLLVASLPVLAQDGPPQQPTQGQQLQQDGRPQPPSREQQQQEEQRMIKALDLTPEQSKQFKVIMKDFHQGMKTVHENQPSREEGRKQVQTLHNQRNEQLKKVLTAQQMETLQNLQQSRRGQQRPQGPPPNNR